MAGPQEEVTVVREVNGASEALRAFAAQLDDANVQRLLSGWPHDLPPTGAEIDAIEAVCRELGIHEPTLGPDRCWYLAGQIVARIKRDARL